MWIRLFVDWVFAAKCGDTGTDFICFCFKVGSCPFDELGNFNHVLFFEATGGDSRSADTQTAGDEWAGWIVWNSVLVCGDINLIQTFSSSLPVMFMFCRSIRIRWLSVPPETRRKP